MTFSGLRRRIRRVVPLPRIIWLGCLVDYTQAVNCQDARWIEKRVGRGNMPWEDDIRIEVGGPPELP